jgi:hypothetical protein
MVCAERRGNWKKLGCHRTTLKETHRQCVSFLMAGARLVCTKININGL